MNKKLSYKELEERVKQLESLISAPFNQQNTALADREHPKKYFELRKSLYEKMFENIGDVIVVIDAQGINRFKSPNITKLFGWLPEEVVGKSTWDNVHPDDLERAREFFIDIMKTPGKSGTLECRYKCRDNTYKWIEFTGKNLFNDSQIQGLLGNYHDITERKKAEQALHESEIRFKALHNASFGGITIHDKGLIIDCNQGLADISGYTVKELIGMDGLLLIAEKSREIVTNHILQGYEKPYQVTGLRKDGSEYPLRLEARNIPYRGKSVRTVEFRDITEQVNAEKEKEKLQAQLIQAGKMEAIGRLAGGIAHDFNNMLGVILGRTEMAIEQAPNDHLIQSDLNEIQQAAEYSVNLTTQLLAFARKQIIDPKILDLNQTLENMIPMMQRLMGEDIELNWIPGLSIDPVKIDPSQINQILANLCVNARDAITDVGKISIKTSNIILDRQFALDNAGAVPGKYVMLLFKDNGKGMDQITLARLFEPFYTTKGIGKGTGLGLAMIYGIVKQNRGYINVLSTLGKGTEFKIYFPAASTEETKKVSQTGPGDNKAIAHGTETILLVEDEPPVLRMTKIMLERRGYHVITADGPDSAIELIQTKGSQIDLLMTDIIMPGMNGKDLADILVIFNPALKCLFMSGYTADIIANKGVLQKGVEFIQKPFSLFQLCSKVRKVLDRNI